MVIGVRDLDESLKKFSLNKRDILQIQDIVEKQLFLFKSLSIKPSKVSLIVVGKKIDGVDVIRIFDKNSVIIEILDTSYTKLRTLNSLENWNTNFLFRITFLENGDYIEIVKCMIEDLDRINVKKVKSLSYGLTDGEDVVKIDVSLQDVKGAEYDILKKAVVYTFNKRTKKKLNDIDCFAVDYS